MSNTVKVFIGEELAAYGFGHGHPFSHNRMQAFTDEFYTQGLDQQVDIAGPVMASRSQIEWFHTHDYVEKVIRSSHDGNGFLDQGDTPAFVGVYDAAATVAGTTLAAIENIIHGNCQRAFVPIAGLHHARPDNAAGFCVFNDCAIAIEALRRQHGIQRIAYVDIDAHHGDGVFYSYESDPDLFIVDIHEDGHYLYPGSGERTETGKHPAENSKLNIPMKMGATDEDFFKVWQEAQSFLESMQPDFILLQCGADSLAGDPITHLQYTAAAHAHAAHKLCDLADRSCNGRLLAMGGGGYNLDNIAQAWCAVVKEFTQAASSAQVLSKA